MTKIHPLATVSPDAILGENVEVGPYAFIDANVEIGDRVTIRECATINRGTSASGKGVTRVGSDTLIMSYVHIAHDCRVGNHCILVSYVGIAGETDVDDWAIIGGSTVVHQFSHIGTHAMVGGGTAVNKDIPPYSICGRNPICFSGINIVGLRRRGFESEVIRNIKDIYDTIYFQGLNTADGCAKVEAGFPKSLERDTILNFIRDSKRGIVRGMEIGTKGPIE